MRKKVTVLLGGVAAALTPMLMAAETTAPAVGGGKDLVSMVIETVVYGGIGIALFVVSYFIFDKVMQLDLRKELVEDQNEALGVMMAGAFIGIGIIIMAAIH
jgi:uncharacterized membrane protein YjfL (UPF0719 family)